jgi:hypothetical protein
MSRSLTPASFSAKRKASAIAGGPAMAATIRTGFDHPPGAHRQCMERAFEGAVKHARGNDEFAFRTAP